MNKITINESELYYTEYGSGDIPVIFIHGLFLSSNMWKDFYLESLPAQYKAYALDMRGHGKSNNVDGCTIQNMAQDVYEFSRKLNLDKFICIGVSMGGGVGLQLALNHQEVLSGLILVSPIVGFGASGAFIFRVFGDFIAQKRWLIRFMIKGLFVHTPPKDLLETALDDTMLVRASSLKEFICDKKPISGLDRLNLLNIPTLIIIGDKDKAIPVEQQIRLSETIPGATKVIYQGEGHMVTEERKQDVVKYILGFLYSLSAKQ